MTAARVSLLRAALRCRCPRCGEGRLYAGLLTVRDTCEVCGLDLRSHDSGDGPAVGVMFLLSAIVVALAFWVEFTFNPPLWVHVVLWFPFTLLGALWMLRVMKAWLTAEQYRYHILGDGPTV